MIQELFDFLAGLPDTSKTAIIASIVSVLGSTIVALTALLGFYLTNRGHKKRLGKQLADARDQQKSEREMHLRKEVYLAAVEAAITTLAVLAEQVDLMVPEKQLGERLSTKAAALTKAHLVASMSTVRAVSDFLLESNRVHLALLLGRNPLRAKQARLQELADAAKGAKQEKLRIFQLTEQLSFAVDREPAYEQFLAESFRIAQKFEHDALKESGALSETFQREWLAYAESCYEGAMRVAERLFPLLVALRKELDLPLESEEYQSLMQMNMDRHRQLMRGFLERLRASLG